MSRGFLLLEFLVSSAIVIMILLFVSVLMFQSRDILTQVKLRAEALNLARSDLQEKLGALKVNFYSDAGVFIDNFTKLATSSASYLFNGREVEVFLSGLVTNTKESFGQSSCRPVQNPNLWQDPHFFSFDLNESWGSVSATDIDLVGGIAYISSNTATALDPDLVIFRYDATGNVSFVSAIDTGPGAESLHVAGHYVYLANTSRNAQLQIVDISNIDSPYLAYSFKIPGTYYDSTAVGNSVFYKNGMVYLGLRKSSLKEFQAIDVSYVYFPFVTDSYELDWTINDITAFEDRVFVVSPQEDELKILTFDSNDRISNISSFDAPGSIGNGKRLSFFLDRIFLGRTQTNSNDEVYVVGVSGNPEEVYRFPIGSSVKGIFAYQDLLFIAKNGKDDGFWVLDISADTPQKINLKKIPFVAEPLNFDCDKSVFGIVMENSSFIQFVTNSNE